MMRFIGFLLGIIFYITPVTVLSQPSLLAEVIDFSESNDACTSMASEVLLGLGFSYEEVFDLDGVTAASNDEAEIVIVCRADKSLVFIAGSTSYENGASILNKLVPLFLEKIERKEKGVGDN